MGKINVSEWKSIEQAGLFKFYYKAEILHFSIYF